MDSYRERVTVRARGMEADTVLTQDEIDAGVEQIMAILDAASDEKGNARIKNYGAKYSNVRFRVSSREKDRVFWKHYYIERKVYETRND